jgi:hypothetical protein
VCAAWADDCMASACLYVMICLSVVSCGICVDVQSAQPEGSRGDGSGTASGESDGPANPEVGDREGVGGGGNAGCVRGAVCVRVWVGSTVGCEEDGEEGGDGAGVNVQGMGEEACEGRGGDV